MKTILRFIGARLAGAGILLLLYPLVQLGFIHSLLIRGPFIAGVYVFVFLMTLSIGLGLLLKGLTIFEESNRDTWLTNRATLIGWFGFFIIFEIITRLPFGIAIVVVAILIILLFIFMVSIGAIDIKEELLSLVGGATSEEMEDCPGCNGSPSLFVHLNGYTCTTCGGSGKVRKI